MTSIDVWLRRAPGLAGLWLALQATAFMLLPKCPLCIAAAFSVWGMSAGAAWTFAAYARPVSLFVLPLALALVWARRWRRPCCSRWIGQMLPRTLRRCCVRSGSEDDEGSAAHHTLRHSPETEA